MKNFKLYTYILGLLLLSSCQNDELVSQGGEMPLEITTSTQIETRTSLADNGKSVLWNEGDAIAVYDFATSKRKFVAEINDNKTHFKGKITPKYGSFIAAYPYDLAAENDVNKKILLYLPEEQTAVKDGFASGLNLSIAKGERNVDGSPSQVQFRNVCQLFKLTIPEYISNRVAKIELTANTAIAGELTVDYSNYDPAVTTSNQGSRTIALLPASGTSAFGSGVYYIVIAPVALDGFTIKLTDTNGKLYTQHSNSQFGGTGGFICNLGSMDMIDKPVITPKHYYSEGVLMGTNVTLTAPVPDKPWSAVIKNANGETVRTLSEGTGILTSDHTDATWPYLPKGNYTVEYNYTTSNGKQMAATSDFTITEDPQFSVTLVANSTYSYYLAGDVDKANSMDKNSVSGIVCQAHGILPSLLANDKYGFALNNNFNGSISSTGDNVANFNDISISQLGETELSASVTFDGTTKTGTQKVRITGLPFHHEPPTSDNWSANNGQTSFESDHVKTGAAGSNGEFSFNGIQVPAGTKMSLQYRVEVYMDNALSTQRYQISVGNQTVFNFSTGDSGTKSFDESQVFTSNADANIIKCYTGYCYGRSNSKTYKIALSYSK